MFQATDDEGYLLIVLKRFQADGHLYDRVYSQYGPLYHQLFAAVFALPGVHLSHDTGRIATLAVWLTISLLVALLTLRLTHSTGLAVISEFLTSMSLWRLTSEPMHPGGLTTLLLAAAGLIAVALYPQHRRRALFVLGGLTGAALMVKVNVGGLLLLAVAYALAVSLQRGRKAAAWTIGAAILVTPLLLVGRHLDIALGLAITTTFSLLAVLVAAARVRGNDGLDLCDVGLAAAGAAAVLVVSSVVAVATGTSAGELLHGIVLDPLVLPRAFSLPSGVGPEAAALAAVVCAATLLRFLGPANNSGFIPWLVIGAGLFLWTLTVLAEGTGGSLAPELVAAPLAVWLPSLREPGEAMAYRFLPLLAVLGVLQAYPIAGSQVGEAAALFVPLGALAIADGWRAVQALPAQSWTATPRVKNASHAAFSGIVAGTVLVALWLRPLPALFAYGSGVTPGFPGTALMRIPEAQASGLREVAAVIKENCDTFESLPGLNSIYIFTDESPPTGFNATAWPWLFGPELQQRIVDASRTHARECAVLNPKVLAFWAEGRPVPRGPLVDYIERKFPHRLLTGDYEVWARS